MSEASNVVSLNVARRRRGLAPVVAIGYRQRERLTVVQAEARHPGYFLGQCYVVNIGAVAHVVPYATQHPSGTYAGAALCGAARGVLTPATADQLMCLRCLEAWPR